MKKGEAKNKKRGYVKPALVRYGTVRELTLSGFSGNTESGAPPQCNPNANSFFPECSDRSAKENIVRVGTHPLGIGLYLFDYKPEFRARWGRGRRFGVMADEVEKTLPNAVTLHADGYKMVHYAMLGIERGR